MSTGLLIIGGQGSGKSRLAMQIAEFIGGEVRVTSEFELGALKFSPFNPGTKILLVEEFRYKPVVTAMLTADKIICRQMAKEDVEMVCPKIICISQFKPHPDNRRFIVIDLGGADDHP